MPILGASSSAAKPAPTVPTSVSASNSGSGRAFNNGAASVSFTAPSTSKLPVTSYTVTSSPGSFTASGASSPLTVTGLQSNTAYTYTVTAASAAGTSSASSASSSVTATTVPQAPTIGTATFSSGATSVTFTAGATGGSTITGYTVTSTSGATGTGASSPISVTETVAGSYTYTVTATNANGTSTASSASNSITASFAFAVLAQNSLGNSTYLSKSTDGMATWSNLAIPVSNASHYANGRTLSTNGTGTWLLAGSNATNGQAGVWYSTNSGSSWTLVAVSVPNLGAVQGEFGHYGEASGGGYWVIGGTRRSGQPASIHYSNTLSSWTYAATGTGSGLATNSVIYASNMTNKWWTTIEGGKTIYSTSNPPSSWTVTTGSVYNQFYAATDGTTVVWAGGQQYANQQYATGSASAATAFTTIDYGAACVAYGNGKFMLAFARDPNNTGSTSALIYTSTSGTGSWSASNSPWGTTYSIIGGGWAGKFYLVRAGGVYATSTDATTWTIVATAPGSDPYSTIKYGT